MSLLLRRRKNNNLFDINNIPKELWMDATDSSTITRDGSGFTSQWNDKSPNAFSFGSIGGTGSRPVSDAGYTKMTFDGSDELRFTGTAGNVISTAEGDVFIACQFTIPATLTSFILSQGDSTIGDGDALSFGVTTLGEITGFRAAGTNETKTNNTFSSATNYILNWSDAAGTGTTPAIYVNNSNETVSSSANLEWFGSNANHDRMTLGGRAASAVGNRIACIVYEIIVTTSQLSAGERNNVFNYLNNKHSLGL